MLENALTRLVVVRNGISTRHSVNTIVNIRGGSAYLISCRQLTAYSLTY